MPYTRMHRGRRLVEEVCCLFDLRKAVKWETAVWKSTHGLFGSLLGHGELRFIHPDIGVLHE